MVDGNDIMNVLRSIESRLKVLEGKTIEQGVTQLEDLSDDMGLIQAGEFRTGTGEPGEGFSGVRVAHPAMDYDIGGSSQGFNIVGVNNDILQFGLDATSGAAIAGAGAVKLDEDGITIEAETTGVWDNRRSVEFTVPPTDLTDGGDLGGIISFSMNDDSERSVTVQCNHGHNKAGDGNANVDLVASDTVLGNDVHLLVSTGLQASESSVTIWSTLAPVLFTNNGDLSLEYYSLLRTTPKGCRVYRNSTQAITLNQYNSLAWNTELYDTDACWAAGDPTKMYAKSEGYYLAGGGFAVPCTAHLTVVLNGNTYLAMNGQMTASRFDITTGMFYMNANDYIQIQVYPSANVTIAAAGSTTQYANHGWLVRIA